MKWLEPDTSKGWCCSPCLDQGRHTEAVVILNETNQDGVQRKGLCGNHAELVGLSEEAEQATQKGRG